METISGESGAKSAGFAGFKSHLVLLRRQKLGKKLISAGFAGFRG